MQNDSDRIFNPAKTITMKQICLSLLLLQACTLSAQDGFTTKSLSVFKNGQSFVVKEGKVPAKDYQYTISQLPQALFGTYWFTGLDAPVSMVTGKMEYFSEKQERKANSFPELLHANKGKTLTVRTSDNNIYKGVVEDFDLPEEINSKLQLQQMALRNSYGDPGFDRMPSPSAPVLMLKMEGKWISIEPATIKSLEFEEKPNRTTTTDITVRKQVVTLHFPQSGEQTVSMMYLQNGLSWTPVYRLSLLSETEAELSLQAEVTNSVEDIRSTDMDFVVGVPNFSQATRLATLLNFTQAAPPAIRDYYSNAKQFLNYSVGEKVSADMFVNENAAAMPNLQASENEDLYFYTVKNVSLQRNVPAQYPIFTDRVKIRHCYRTELPVSRLAGYRVGNAEAEENAEEDSENAEEMQAGDVSAAGTVAHYIEIDNGTKNPLTAGPVLILQGNTKALAQSELKFTGKGAATSVLVTQAPDITVKEHEKIISVAKNAKKWNGYTFALLTIRSTVTVANTKSKAASLQIDKHISGKLTNATTRYGLSTLLNSSGDINKSQALRFSADAAPASQTSFTYTYQMYVRE